ncbi:hypothetical protein O0L34_g6854 [Tuta absoluta]|nr:hypothetical protein O0L34_g6854 [Tuta absoluta]
MRTPRIAQYNTVRNDRVSGSKGGTLIHYRRALHCSPIETPPLCYMEASACRLSMTGHQPITIVSVYLSPSNNRETKPLLKSELESLFNLGDSVIIAGDLNAKHMSWNCIANNPRGNLLFEWQDELSFDLVAPTEVTHYPHTVTHRPDILDIALLKNVNLRLSSIEVRHELCDSDHRPVLLKLDPRTDIPGPSGLCGPTKTIVDWPKLGQALNAPSSTHLDQIPTRLTTETDINLAVSSITNHVSSVVNSCSRTVKITEDSKYKPPNDLLEMITEKNAAIRAYKSFPIESNRLFMRALQREVRQRAAEWRDAGWDQHLEELNPSHLAFYKLQRSLKSDTISVMPVLNRPDQTKAFDDDEKAECLADSLAAQCTPSTLPYDLTFVSTVDSEVERLISLPPSGPPLRVITEMEVRNALKTLKPRKAPGPDGITNRVLKILPDHLINRLTLILNAAMASCTFPACWKEAIVIGIHKPGKPANEPTSYRPISLLNPLAKLYERMIYARLRDHAETNNLIPDEQFGFRQQHSYIWTKLFKCSLFDVTSEIKRVGILKENNVSIHLLST